MINKTQNQVEAKSLTNKPIKGLTKKTSTNQLLSITSKVPVLTPRVNFRRTRNNTWYIVQTEKYMFHTKDGVVMLITQTHPQSKISILHLNVHIEMIASYDNIEQYLSNMGLSWFSLC